MRLYKYLQICQWKTLIDVQYIYYIIITCLYAGPLCRQNSSGLLMHRLTKTSEGIWHYLFFWHIPQILSQFENWGIYWTGQHFKLLVMFLKPALDTFYSVAGHIMLPKAATIRKYCCSNSLQQCFGR